MKVIKIVALIILLVILSFLTFFMCGYFILTEFNRRVGESIPINFYIHLSIVILIIIVYIYYVMFFFKEIKKLIKK